MQVRHPDRLARAGGLVEAAAESDDRTRTHAAFDKMIETCSTCHETFATDRFPSFAGE